jgi:hypothetical protein
MKPKINYSPTGRILTILLLLLMGGLTALAQGPRAFSADDSGINWKVNYLFNETIPQSNLVSVVLLDAVNGTTVKITNYVFMKGDVAGEADGFSIPSIALDKKSTYFLVISIMKKKADGSFEVVSSTTPKIAFASIFSTETKPANGFTKEPTESKAKKDSDVYVAGEWGGSKGKKTTYSTEIKIQPTLTSGRWYYTPFFFTLNASTDPDADPDVMEIGASAGYIYPFKLQPTENWKFRITGLDTSFGAKIESERDFDNTNLIFNGNLSLVPTTIPIGKRSTLSLDPFIGTELGKNLKSPLPAARGDGIARVLAGANIILDVPLAKTGLQGITWDTSYTRRWLFSNELGFKTNDDDELVLTTYGKSPRDFFQSKVEFTINKFLNPYVSYEWGEVPPSYKLVDHRFRVGFVYKFKLSAK